jgi:magnesium-protoporphyrin O-methyltransferase
MPSISYALRRQALEHYFDRTALEAWTQLTSDAPVSRIRATVRAGRDRMRALLLDWLPSDLSGLRIADLGCGTGALSVAAAERGAQVVAVDVSASLIGIARERTPPRLVDLIEFHAADMTDPALGYCDHAVMMDSLVHYETPDIAATLGNLADRVRHSIVFTVAPRTPLLTAMHFVGSFFPRSDRAPAIVPVSMAALKSAIAREKGLAGWSITRSERIDSGFYLSRAVELRRS